MQKAVNWWNEQDGVIKASIGVLAFAIFVIFLAWVALWLLAPLAAVWVTGITFAIALFIAVSIAIAILTEEL